MKNESTATTIVAAWWRSSTLKGRHSLERKPGPTAKRGFVERVTSPEGVIQYAYDIHGRITQTSFHGSDFTPSEPENDFFDNVTQYDYDDLGRLHTVTVTERNNQVFGNPGDQDVTSYAYDLVGNLDTTTYDNGLIHDYDYDALNRLDELYHWIDANADGKRDANELRAEFDYTLRPDGKRVGVDEKFWDESGSVVSERSTTWNYDLADRVISEIVEDQGAESYHLNWLYDLAGNRVVQSREGDSGTESITYEYDANDRLLVENISTDSSFQKVKYDHNQTQQTFKETSGVQGVTKTQVFTYNLQGRLSRVTTSEFDSYENEATSDAGYEYDSAGNRVATVSTSDVGGNPTTVRREHLTDSKNHTGYSQVLLETEFDEDGQPIKKIVYAVGHDQISQTVYTRVDTDGDGTPDAWDAGQTHYFGTDGHGNVRVLLDALNAIVTDTQNNGLAQIFHYDAYGNLLGFDGIQPLTAYLYSGEAFDFNIGQQYLRARWYDATNGRFNRLDPFFGNADDPHSFHKYAYVHGDPIHGVDPTGKFLASLAFANMAGLEYNLEVFMSGLITAGILETGGSAGLNLRAAGLALIANGDHTQGWYFYKFGSAFAAQSFGSVEMFTGVTSGAQVTAMLGVGAVKLLRAAPEIAQGLLNARRVAAGKLGMLFRRRAKEMSFSSAEWEDPLGVFGTTAFVNAYIDLLKKFEGRGGKVWDHAAWAHVKGRPAKPHPATDAAGNKIDARGSFEPKNGHLINLYAGPAEGPNGDWGLADDFTFIEELHHAQHHQEYLHRKGLTQAEFKTKYENWSVAERVRYHEEQEDAFKAWMISFGFVRKK